MGTDWGSSTNKSQSWNMGGISIGEKLLVEEFWPYVLVMLYTLLLPELFEHKLSCSYFLAVCVRMTCLVVWQARTHVNFSSSFAHRLKIILIGPYINFLFDLVLDQRFSFILFVCLFHYTASSRSTRHNLTPPTLWHLVAAILYRFAHLSRGKGLKEFINTGIAGCALCVSIQVRRE